MTQRAPQQKRITCPKCHRMSGILMRTDVAQEEPVSGDSRDHGHLPEGLAGSGGVTAALCEAQDCLHEWETVTHRQILLSLRQWRTSPHGGPSF